MTKKQRGRPTSDFERDLKSELLRASRLLLDEGGVNALSMREVARRVGCTHQAPYHYFENREAILANLVSEGFDNLADSLRVSNDLAETFGLRVALIASGRAYVGFALSQLGVFRIMFRPDVCNPERFPSVQVSAQKAYAQLQRLTSLVYGEKAVPAMATILWSHVHGLACLIADGHLAMGFASSDIRQAHLDEVAERFADIIFLSR